MRTPIFAIALALIAALATPAAAAPGEAEARARIEALLRGYHGLPDRDHFEAAAADPAKVLRVIAADPYAGPLRAAALEALKWWPDASTLALYTEAVRPESPTGLRHKVLRYLPVFGERALPLLAEAAADGDPQIRRTAAAALFDVPGDAAGKALAAAARAESDPVARAEMQRLVERRATLR